MEFVEGRNLKEIIKQEGPLPNKTAVFIAATKRLRPPTGKI